MVILLTTVFLTIFVSAQCSLYEATLYSTRMGTLETERHRKKRRRLATAMLDMKQNISVPIAAILILNTVANTAGATIAGMYAQQVFGSVFVPVFSIILTLAILFIAEIIPKTIGAIYWRTFWPYIVRPLQLIKTLLSPMIYVTGKVTSLLTPSRAEPMVTADDILGLIKQGTRESVISEWEGLMTRNIIELEKTTVRAIMTPRTVMFALESQIPIGKALEMACDRGHTRIPVYVNDKDTILGYVRIHELSAAQFNNTTDNPISSIAQPVPFIRDTENCMNLLLRFLRKRQHIAIIQDEYGGVSGLVSLEDLLETVLGTEIVDETDKVEDMQQLAKDQDAKHKKSIKKKTD